MHPKYQLSKIDDELCFELDDEVVSEGFCMKSMCTYTHLVNKQDALTQILNTVRQILPSENSEAYHEIHTLNLLLIKADAICKQCGIAIIAIYTRVYLASVF